MRLFAAVGLPAQVADDLRDLVDRVRPLAPPELRWTDPGLWHVTVAFFGEVPDEVVDDLSTRLGRAAARAAPLSLQVTGLGAFPRHGGGGARVLWAAVAGDVVRLDRLARAAAAAGRRAVPGRADAPAEAYHPHVTLARCRGRGGADARTAVAAASAHAGPFWPADALILVRSHLGPQVRYEHLASYPLSGRVP